MSIINDLPPRATHTYRAADGHASPADVIGAAPGARKPALLWIHGGGLIFGSRCWSPRASFARALLARDFVIVSIDHRLAPEAKLPRIFEDVQGAWRWLHEEGAQRFGIDPARVAIGGASAGGYLSLLGGVQLAPRPRAVASFWGYGDIAAPWETTPSVHYLTSAEPVSRDAALASLAAPPLRDPAEGIDRSIFYLYCRQQGCWVQEVTGQQPGERAWLAHWSPLHHIDRAYPPTALVHGTADADVPHEASEHLAARLATAGVVHRFLSLPAVGHGFSGAAPGLIEETEAAVADFLQAHLQ